MQPSPDWLELSNPKQKLPHVAALEQALGKTAEKEFLPLQAGDVPDAYANVDDLVQQFHYKPATTMEEGIDRFVAWYREYFAAALQHQP